jgi:DNA-binding CsgD family transcriptional regulator
MKSVIEICEALLEADDLATFRSRLEAAAHAMNCERFGGFVLLDANPANGQPQRIERIDNVPETFDGYVAPQAMKRDPVMQLVKTSGLPMVWTQDTYVKAGCGELWEEGARWGMVSGMIMAMHLPGGRHFCLGMETSRHLNPADPRRSAELADLSLVLAYAQAVSERLLLSPAAEPSESPLSAREREVLQWAAAGKTAWETGIIMSISDSTVNKHLDSAVKKLDCSNKVHAVAKALRAGWLG